MWLESQGLFVLDFRVWSTLIKRFAINEPIVILTRKLCILSVLWSNYLLYINHIIGTSFPSPILLLFLGYNYDWIFRCRMSIKHSKWESFSDTGIWVYLFYIMVVNDVYLSFSFSLLSLNSPIKSQSQDKKATKSIFCQYTVYCVRNITNQKKIMTILWICTVLYDWNDLSTE